MYIKKIKATDFNGREYEQEYYFNLTTAELIELECSIDGGLQEYIKRITNTEKTTELVPLFKKLVLMSYGERSDDGKRFVKEDPVRGNLGLEFSQTAAYAQFFTELATNDKSAAEFINGILPSEEEVNKLGGGTPAPQIAQTQPAVG